MIVYFDEAFKCHTSCGERMRAVDVPFFDGKCAEYIEGYRYVPEGESWTREDGVVFHGEMIAPWKPFSELDAAQREHESELAKAAMILLGEV